MSFYPGHRSIIFRIVYGYVTDMFHTPYGHGIFNLSDISLQVGVVCLLMYAVIQPKRKRE
ncbi:signal peptidase II [Alicyclobacillus dauci]|uniref:signal peptidase II n=1 Tax=Alicyclobacillus dauci TaxID=1475485 RepID=UPI003898FFC8